MAFFSSWQCDDGRDDGLFGLADARARQSWSDAPVRDLGGKGANQALILKRAGAEVRFVAAIGRDETAGWVAERLAAEGFRVADLMRLAQPTDRSLIFVSPEGENAIALDHRLRNGDRGRSRRRGRRRPEPAMSWFCRATCRSQRPGRPAKRPAASACGRCSILRRCKLAFATCCRSLTCWCSMRARRACSAARRISMPLASSACCRLPRRPARARSC